MYIYEKLKIVAIVVAKFATPAINIVLFLVNLATISTNIIVNIVLNICSIVWDFAVTDNFCFPLKYPRSTDVIDTKNIDGQRATNEYSASGISSHTFAIILAFINNSTVPINPKKANVKKAILNILCAPLLSPIANLSETNFAIAFGTPVDENVNSKAYI